MKQKQVLSLALIMLAIFVLCGCGSKQEMEQQCRRDERLDHDGPAGCQPYAAL